MGWAPWANLEKINQPYSLVYADLTWRDFEPQQGLFDFEKFEEKQQISKWRQEGKRVVFRFVLDIPQTETHIDIPNWLFEKINGDGNFYDNEYGKGFSPNYSNPELIKYHQLAIQALGDRYGQDNFFAFVELGSLGHWGEWHIKSDLLQPLESVRDLYVQQYVDAFPETRLLMRRPFRIAKDFNLGLYNDLTGDVESTNTWLDWIANGGDYLPNDGALVAMPDAWKFAPIGGEQSPVLDNNYVYGSNLEQTLSLLRKSHTTFIGPGGPYEVELGSNLQEALDQVLATIGYRLYIVNTEMPYSVNFGNSIDIMITLSNAGIAPFYYEWDVNLYLLNQSGVVLKTQPVSLDLRKIIPNQDYKKSFTLNIENLQNQKYFVGFAIIDPLTGLPGVKLANQNTRNDLIQIIGSFEIKKLFNEN